MTNYLIWGLKSGDTPIGAMGLKKLTLVDAEYWGYIGDRRFWGMGFGLRLMRFAGEQAKRLNLTSIYLRVHRENERAVRLYEKSGFKNEREEGYIRILRLNLG